MPDEYRSFFIDGYSNSAVLNDKSIVVFETDTIKDISRSLERTSIPQSNKKSSSKSLVKPFKTKRDYIKENIRNLDIGERGEKLVFEMEKEKLLNAVKTGKIDSIENHLKWVSIEDDSLGYDIISYDIDKMSPVYIEVKTTTGSGALPFYMSENELNFSKQNTKNYKLYRVYNLKKSIANYYELTGDISSCAHVEVSPIDYLVSLKR